MLGQALEARKALGRMRTRKRLAQRRREAKGLIQKVRADGGYFQKTRDCAQGGWVASELLTALRRVRTLRFRQQAAGSRESRRLAVAAALTGVGGFMTHWPITLLFHYFTIPGGAILPLPVPGRRGQAVAGLGLLCHGPRRCHKRRPQWLGNAACGPAVVGYGRREPGRIADGARRTAGGSAALKPPAQVHTPLGRELTPGSRAQPRQPEFVRSETHPCLTPQTFHLVFVRPRTFSHNAAGGI